MSSKLFSQLKEIRPEKKGSYRNLFLTIDIDWADDAVVNDTIDIIERAEVEATWFITHDSGFINRLRMNPKFELGIHPNFNFLLDGDPRNGDNYRSVIEKLMRIVPEAKSLRSHSLVTSTKLLELMPEFGLSHESNHYVPLESCEDLRPYRVWNQVVRIPHAFEDDLFLLSGIGLNPIEQDSFTKHIKRFLDRSKGVRVLDFHPIHVFLNTENLNRYERTRKIHRIPEELVKHRYSGEGTRSALEALLGLS